MKRDPLKDPKAGDVVLLGPQWQRERYEIQKIDNGMVGYIMNGALLWTTLQRWQEWCAIGSAEVLHAAD
jgi:hypothetical protein